MILPVVWLVLGQEPTDVDAKGRLQKAERAVGELLERSKAGGGNVQVEVAAGDKLHLDFEKEILCAQLAPSAAVPSGSYRVQCDDERRQCLASPNRVLRDGVETEEELQRTSICSPLPPQGVDRLVADGYRFVEAVAEAPAGWFRDDQGRIIQVNFDLHRRVYFGGAWAPMFSPGHASDFSAAQGTLALGRADFGIEIELPNDAGRELHRLHLLEGSAWLGSQVRIMVTAVRYDWSARHLSAPLWLTTFVGRPHRFDLDVNITGWFEALRYELVSDKSFLTLASANAAFDLWHSKDLQSYLRLRLGPAAEVDLNVRAFALRPEAALEADFTLDADGFHHLTAQVTGEKLFFEPHLDGRRANPERLRAKVGYELILLAINDYPLTLVVDGHAGWRDDLPNVVPGWEFGADVGLRFSFWAPQRRTAAPVNHRG